MDQTVLYLSVRKSLDASLYCFRGFSFHLNGHQYCSLALSCPNPPALHFSISPFLQLFSSSSLISAMVFFIWGHSLAWLFCFVSLPACHRFSDSDGRCPIELAPFLQTYSRPFTKFDENRKVGGGSVWMKNQARYSSPMYRLMVSLHRLSLCEPTRHFPHICIDMESGHGPSCLLHFHQIVRHLPRDTIARIVVPYSVRSTA